MTATQCTHCALPATIRVKFIDYVTMSDDGWRPFCTEACSLIYAERHGVRIQLQSIAMPQVSEGRFYCHRAPPEWTTCHGCEFRKLTDLDGTVWWEQLNNGYRFAATKLDRLWQFLKDEGVRYCTDTPSAHESYLGQRFIKLRPDPGEPFANWRADDGFQTVGFGWAFSRTPPDGTTVVLNHGWATRFSWGERVQVERSPGGYAVGRKATLLKPGDSKLAALLEFEGGDLAIVMLGREDEWFVSRAPEAPKKEVEMTEEAVATTYDSKAFAADLDAAILKARSWVWTRPAGGGVAPHFPAGVSMAGAMARVCQALVVRALGDDVWERQVEQIFDDARVLLLHKNQAYGDSALKPVRVFSSASLKEQLLVRLDDKVSRLERGASAGEDVLADMLGYLLLVIIAENRSPTPPRDL